MTPLSSAILPYSETLDTARSTSRYAYIMFEIPSDLPLNLGSLAWLLGSWQGWGTRSEVKGEAEQPDSIPVLQQIDASVVGDRLQMRIQIFDGVLEEEFDPLWDAKTGLERIRAGELHREETLYWVVDSPLAVMPVDPDQPRELRVVSADTEGFAILWGGVAMGPRIQLASDGVARAPSARDAAYFARMFGLVAGELMWAAESMPQQDGAQYEVDVTGRLLRVSSEDDR